jgi:hypothetical protein
MRGRPGSIEGTRGAPAVRRKLAVLTDSAVIPAPVVLADSALCQHGVGWHCEG